MSLARSNPFDTAFVSHRATLTTDRFDQLLAYNVGSLGSFDSNIYDPGPRPLFANSAFDWNPSRSTESKRGSYAVADTMSVLNERIQFTAGGRQQYIDERTFDTDGATSTRYRATGSPRPSRSWSSRCRSPRSTGTTSSS